MAKRVADKSLSNAVAPTLMASTSFLQPPAAPARLWLRSCFEVCGLCPAAHPLCIGPLPSVRRRRGRLHSQNAPRSWPRFTCAATSARWVRSASGDLWMLDAIHALAVDGGRSPPALTFANVLLQLESSDRLEISASAQETERPLPPRRRGRGPLPPRETLPTGLADPFKDDPTCAWSGPQTKNGSPRRR